MKQLRVVRLTGTPPHRKPDDEETRKGILDVLLKNHPLLEYARVTGSGEWQKGKKELELKKQDDYYGSG